MMVDFVARLDEINALAESMRGFVWRLQDGSGNATLIQAFDDPHILVNMSVWASIEDLFDYVYKTAHTKVMARRREWFDMPSDRHVVLWWVPAGHTPDIEEAKARLEKLRRKGPTAEAFTFKERFPPSADESGEAA